MWFWFALGAAILSAVSVTINKRLLGSISPVVLTWVLFVIPIPIYCVLLVFNGLPSVTEWFWVGAVGSALVFSVAKTWSLQVIKEHDLSDVYPLQTFSVFFSYVIALFFLSEHVSLLSFIGLLLVILGAYALNSGKGNGNLLAPLKHLLTDSFSRLYLGAAFLTGISAVLDKLAITSTGDDHPLPALLVECVSVAAILSLYIIKQKRPILSEVRQHIWVLLLAGLVYLGVAMLVFYGFASGPIALVIGIKKLQVFFVLLLSFLFFKDRPSRYSLVSAVLMVVGAILIKLG